ncbi:MAG: alpha-E domain-containing protein [Verrucomicrobiales bacterium]|nr:alpha-E domain-containing protein [Verrucomicrobiales bacterium]MCP5525814.1 alpha-E domain-containing protein [Verrucomicrobiales bacterium]
MLSRVAESIYWISRYVERAENVARFIDVNLQLMIDAPAGFDQQWLPLVYTTGDQDEFKRRYSSPNAESVVRFLAFDLENPNSIVRCVRAARENARTVREIISSEMWLQLNKFHLMVSSAAARGGGILDRHDFFGEVKLASQTFAGLTNSTLTHGEPWHWCRLGRQLERADKTSRMLDVKYFILLRSVADVGSAFDEVQWAAVLRSASAFEMYRKRFGRIAVPNIVDFLMLHREFPRAVLYCLTTARDALHAISGTPLGTFRHAPEKLLGQLCSELAYTTVEELLSVGLHEYIDRLQTKINQVGNGIFESFLALRAPE